MGEVYEPGEASRGGSEHTVPAMTRSDLLSSVCTQIFVPRVSHRRAALVIFRAAGRFGGPPSVHRLRGKHLPKPSFLRAPWIAPAALVVALASLGVNLWLIQKLRAPEKVAGPAIERVLRRMAEEDARIRYTIRVPAGTPLHFDVPVDESYTVKLRTQIPIDTEVRVPIRGPLGTATVRVPIKTTIPINRDVPVRIRDTFNLRTETKTEFVVPLELRVRDLPLRELNQALEP